MKTVALGLLCLLALRAQAPNSSTSNLYLSLILSPDEKFALVLDSGTKPGISVRESASPDKEISRLDLPSAWLGLTFAPDKKTIYAGGGARGSVFEIAFSPEGTLTLKREMKASDFVGDVALSPDGHLIYAADVFADLVAVINPQSGRVIDRFKTGRRPYRVVFHPDGKSYFVSSWADATVYHYNAQNGAELGRIRLGPHTTDMVLSSYKPMPEEGEPAPDWKYRLFVAASNTNDVYSVGIGENKTMNLLETVSLAPEPLSPLGMTPTALALSGDQHELLVACSDPSSVAKVDVSGARGVLENYAHIGYDNAAGFYPAAVRALPDGKILAALRDHGVSVYERFEAFQEPRGFALPPIRVSPTQAPSNASARVVEHVVYIIQQTLPEKVMEAIAGTAPDFTVKLSNQPKFDLADPANLPPAGYLWTSALAVGMTIQNYGVFMKNGQAIDPPLREFTEPDPKVFFDDLKEGEAAGDMPRLILMQTSDRALIQAVQEAVKKSRFASSTEVVIDDLPYVEKLLGLKPMTRRDALRR